MTETANINEILAAVIAQTQQPDFGAKIITGDEVEFHDRSQIVLPQAMTFKKAQDVLKRLEREAETPTHFQRKFKYRPQDGAYAAMQCIKKRWGMALGKVMETPFGDRPAQKLTINIGPNQTMQVPWGLLEVPIFNDTELYLDSTHDEYGQVFLIHGKGPRKYQDEFEGLFDDIEAFLKTNSIYRGHALMGSNNLEFMDLSTFDSSQIIFSDEVTTTLEGVLFAPMRYTEAFRREGVPLKRTLLLEGPYGTGKTSIGMEAAEVAVAHGWTYLSAKTGRDSVEDVLKTARLYSPAVVFIEDIDKDANISDPNAVSRLLEAFDGASSKGGEIMVVMTTNHIESIHAGMLRPGRLDAVVRIAGLDRNGIERLVKVAVADGKLSPTVDFDAVAKAMEGYLPAFIRETINRAVAFAIAREKGAATYEIGTEDLVAAANMLRPQYEAQLNAGEGQPKPAIDAAIRDLLTDMAVYNPNYEEYYRIAELNSNDEVISTK